MRILFVSSQMLFAGTRFGGAKRLYYLARELERRAELTVLSLDGCRELRGAERPQSEFRRQMVIPLPMPGAFRRATEFMPGVSALFGSNRAAILELLGDGGFDACLMAYPMSLKFLDADWGRSLGRRVYMEDDLLIEQYRQRAAAGSLASRILGRMRFNQAMSYFGSRLPGLDACVCISGQEERIVRDSFPGVVTRVLKYGLPLEDFPILPTPDGRKVMGFIGNYHHTPNADALSWLLDDLFPFVSRQVPDAELVVAGRNLPESIRAKHEGDDRVRFLGDVDDLGSFYRSIGVFVNPVRQGRGLRTKAVEAAAFGRPVLSTPLGAEGLEEMATGLFEDREGFLKAFLEVTEPGRYRVAAERHRAAVERGFSLKTLGAELAGVLSGSAEAPGTGRARGAAKVPGAEG
jgi:glycosyltransferase involved in cell wall biosynthesis